MHAQIRFGGSSRIRATRTLTLGAAVACGALLLSSCGSTGGAASTSGSGGSSQSAEQRVVKIAVYDAPPSAWNETTARGYWPELAELVLTKMGMKAEMVPGTIAAAIPSVISKRVDASLGFAVTADRCKTISYAEPSLYYLNGFAVQKGNPKGIQGNDDEQALFKGIAASGATMSTLAGANYYIDAAKKAGVPEANISTYPDFVSGLDAVKAGRVDGFYYDNVSISYYVGDAYKDSLEAVEPLSGPPLATSFVFQKDEADLAAAFSKTQAEMFASGELDPLFKKYSLSGASSPTTYPNAPTMAEACAAAK